MRQRQRQGRGKRRGEERARERAKRGREGREARERGVEGVCKGEGERERVKGREGGREEKEMGCWDPGGPPSTGDPAAGERSPVGILRGQSRLNSEWGGLTFSVPAIGRNTEHFFVLLSFEVVGYCISLHPGSSCLPVLID